MTSFNAVKETALFYIEQSLRLHPAHQEDLLMLRALFYATQGDFDSALSDIGIVCRNPHNQLAAALRMLFWERAARALEIPSPQTIPHLQRGRVPIAVLLN
jgi:regulator of sirC expression with transglutaminase-like and TPR domain